ncbi:MAG: hypothetical protein GOP50_13260, partial [Candidatus Heimdallarchaeota archaeon]|nr:hypothetical protein [Candidatus Heimdallarchaeota archaeon]
MRIQNIIKGMKEDIPEKYLEGMFKLMQKTQREYLPVDPPHLDFYRRSWKVPELSWVKNIRFVGLDENDEVVSYAWLGWNTKFDNLEQAWHFIHLYDNEEKENNRLIMFKEIVKNIPEQIKTLYAWYLSETKEEHLYDKIKDEHAYEEFFYIANLEEQNLEKISLEAHKQKKKALQKGYDIIVVDDLNYKEEIENYPKFVNLMECVWNDMPREQLSEENSKLTVERYDEQCENNLQNWENFWSFVAIERETKDPVGITVSVISDNQPHVAWQWETGVLHEHRGNGLGLVLKYQMLERLLNSK